MQTEVTASNTKSNTLKQSKEEKKPCWFQRCLDSKINGVLRGSIQVGSTIKCTSANALILTSHYSQITMPSHMIPYRCHVQYKTMQCGYTKQDSQHSHHHHLQYIQYHFCTGLMRQLSVVTKVNAVEMAGSSEMKIKQKISKWAIPCKMKLEVNSQISKHELNLFLLVRRHQKSHTIVHTTPRIWLSLFPRHRMRDFVFKKQILTHVTKNVICDAVFLKEPFFISSELHFLQNIGTVLFAGLFESK